jgi:hypothetical protein
MKLLRSYLRHHKQSKRRPLRVKVAVLHLAVHQKDAADIRADQEHFAEEDDEPPSLCDGESSDKESDDEHLVPTRSKRPRAAEEARPTIKFLTPDPSSSESDEYSYESGDDSSDDMPLSSEENYLSALQNNEDLQSYLYSELCSKNGQAVHTMLGRVANFLSWFDKRLSGNESDMFFLTNALITTHYKLLPRYLVHLSTVLMFKAATVSNYIEDIIFFANWFVVFRVTVLEEYPLSCSNLHSISVVVKAMRKVYYKKRKADFNREANSIEDLIAALKWPANGIADLYDACVQQLPWLERVIKEESTGSKATYDNFMELLCASAYSSSVQGRVHAIDGLKCQSLGTMLTSDAVMSSSFKTSRSFGLQPVTVSPLFRHLLNVYVTHFRPKQFGLAPGDSLFVSLRKKTIRVGDMVTRFFRRTLGLHITTTRVRAIVETSSEQLRENGDITEADRTSILNINGHSGATADKHYVKKTRMGDVSNAQHVFEKLLPNHDATAFPTQDTSALLNRIGYVRDVAVAPQIMPVAGNLHPHFTSTNKRVPWSAAELKYVGSWCTTNSHVCNVVAKCLHSIRNDPSVLSIFHPIHIADSARLRHGWDTYRNK